MRQLEQGRTKLRIIIFGTETAAGRLFDIVLILAILASVGAVMLASIPVYNVRYGRELYAIEWFFTILFTIEYAVRIWIARSKRRYILSFYGVIDLLAILPTYLSLLLPGSQYLIVVRGLRVLRVFRILKLLEFISGANILREAVWRARHKIIVFFITVLSIVVVVGALIYLIEGPENGFTSIPISVYWTIVTLTTVGYGDISPATGIGRTLASLVMLLGYAIIAVPTGIISSELTMGVGRVREEARRCPRCGEAGHIAEARYCHRCAEPLPEEN